MIESKYLEFRQAPGFLAAKTEVWFVLSKSQGALLGTIKWWSGWRQYCFFPEQNTLFNPGCMADISTKIKELMEERKARRTG